MQATDAQFNPYRWVAGTLATLFRYDLDPSRRLLAPGPADRHTTEWLTLSTGDQTIPAYLFRPKIATGAAVAFGHGAGAEMLVPYFKLIETLLQRGISVLSFEIDGHGGNPKDLTYPSCLSCVPKVLNSMRSMQGLDPERIGYYGMSLGAVLGLRAALSVPWIKAMVLIAAPLRVEISEWSRLQEMLGTLNPINAPTLFDASLEHVMQCFFNPVRFGPEEAHTLLDRPFYEAAGSVIHALDPLGHAPMLPPIPTRLLYGEWDTIAPVESARQLLMTLPGPADLITFPRKNHFTILFHRKAALSAADWFEQHL